MSQGPGGPPRWPPGSGLPPGHPAHRGSPSPFRGPPPRPGWASPIPPRMTQSPPPFLIRPMVAGQHRGAPSPIPPGSPIPPFMSPPRWSPSPIPGGGTPLPPNFGHPHPMMAPRPFFRPIMSPSPPPPPHHMGQYPTPPPPPQIPQDMMSPEMFNLQPSYDVEFVYPPGMDPDSMRRRMTPQISQQDDEGGPTTAQIIAAQSQDYVDERLAEYQATIQHLQGF